MDVDFIKRLQNVFEHYQLSPSKFAEKIGVQRSAISHLLSGRNKPSLDLVLKILKKFPEVEFNWLFLGKGEFPKKNTDTTPLPSLFAEEETTPAYSKSKERSDLDIAFGDRSIEKIILLYKSGKFKVFENEP